MVSTSTTNPGLSNIISRFKATGAKPNPNYDKERESQKKAWRDALNNSQSSSTPSSGSDGASTESSSGDGITSLNDASSDVQSNNGTDGSSSDGATSGTTSDGSSSDGSSTSGSSGGSTSPLLDGTMSFEELIGEICNGIDLIFAVKRTTIVVTDYESIYAEAKYLRDIGHESVKSEMINLWQLEEGSYELDVSEYGFYNTVKVHYKNGIVEESYDDLVKVYGKVTIDYYDKKIDKTTAIMKAKAYLAAHVRDFDMSVKANMLFDADIDIGDIVTIENPMTMRDRNRVDVKKIDPEYFFVKGKSISWEGDTDITASLELRYGAESPERKEVPEAGTSYSNADSSSSTASSGNISKAIDEVGKMASKISYSGACQTHDCVKQQQTGDCHGMSDFIACELKARGVQAKIYQYAAIASNHRSVKYQDASGQWIRFPYREYGVEYNFRDTDGVDSGSEISSTC